MSGRDRDTAARRAAGEGRSTPADANRRLVLGSAAALLVPGGRARAQAWPARPMRFVVPYPPGGIGDTTARALGGHLADRLGQPVVVENRAGASQMIGAEAVAKSPPDGYTIFLGSLSSLVLNLGSHKSLPYDPVKDFVPVSVYFSTPLYLVVHPSVPARTVPELIAHLKANPGKLSYGSIGTGSSLHLTAEMFCKMAGVDALHVPYKGSVPAVTDLISGQIQFMFDAGTSSLPPARSGKLRVLASTGLKRSEGTPDIPSMAESGLPGFDASFWFGIVAPAGTPAPVVQRLSREIGEICRLPAMREKFLPAGVELVGSTADEMAAQMRSDLQRWPAIQRAAGVRPE